MIPVGSTGTRERHGTQDLLPAKGLGELLVLEYTVLIEKTLPRAGRVTEIEGLGQRFQPKEHHVLVRLKPLFFLICLGVCTCIPLRSTS